MPYDACDAADCDDADDADAADVVAAGVLSMYILLRDYHTYLGGVLYLGTVWGLCVCRRFPHRGTVIDCFGDYVWN